MEHNSQAVILIFILRGYRENIFYRHASRWITKCYSHVKKNPFCIFFTENIRLQII